MGLLDVLNSEQGRLGLGLLAAAGGRSDGAGFGQRMAEGIGSVDQWKKQQAQAKFQQMQADEMQAQVEARKAKAVEEARIKALIQGLGQPKPGMGAGLPAGTLPGAFDIGSQVPALEQSGKIDFQALMRQGVPFEILKNLAESANLGKQKVARTAEIEGANGQKIVQGFDDYGQRVGQGENGYIAPVMVDQGGTKGFQKPVAGASFPVGMSPSERDSSARGWASNALAKEKFAYDKTQDAVKAPSAAKETPADTRTREADDALATIAQAEKLIDSSTNSYLGAGMDQAARVFGVSTTGAQSAAKLKALEGALISKMPKMSGPQSDKDVLLYKQMAGQIGDSTIPGETKKAAIQTIKEIQKRYASPDAIAAADAPSKPSRAPMKGQTVDGYKFKGGDPSNPANWEKQ